MSSKDLLLLLSQGLGEGSDLALELLQCLPQEGEVMYLTEDRMDGVCEKVEDLSTKVALLKDGLAKQTFNVRLEHHWELENIRNCFAEFKWRIQQLDTDEDSQAARHRQALDTAWTELVHAIDVLLAALLEKGATRNGPQAIRV